MTCWTTRRDGGLDERIVEKVAAAREYYRPVQREFERTHSSAMSAHFCADDR